MAYSINKVQLIGNLGKDPEIRHVNDQSVAQFPLATTEVYKDRSGDRKEVTEWHNIVAWRWMADVSEKQLKKGSKVFIEGKIRSRSWDDKDGNKRYITEILTDNIIPFEKRESDGQGGNNYSSSVQSGSPTPEASDAGSEEDDLPF
ncbi:MAG: single-stranded DNA-binding protein [Bacteroidia bacterium]